MQHITSSADPLMHRLKDLLRSKTERPRTIVIDDYENIEQAVKAQLQIETVFIATTASNKTATLTAHNKKLDTIFSAANQSAPVTITIEPTVIKSVFGDDKQVKVFALAIAPKPYKLSALAPKEHINSDIVVLDGVKIVGNIGAITRTACALGAAGIVLLDSGLTSIFDRRLVRASRGLVFSLPVVIASRAQFTDFVNKHSLPLAILDINATQPLCEISKIKEPLALVFGSERDGVSTALSQLAQHRYVIDMDQRVESLNVSVTAGIALFQHALSKTFRKLK